MATFTGRFLQLSKLTTEWNAADPVLMNGELGVADAGSSAPILKVGDGVRPWSALPQISGSGGGAANDYVVGTTTTLAPGSFATVTIDNSVDPPTISFGIPRGNTGPANTLAIGTTTTGAPGTPASATITGTPPAQTLNLIIPQGDVGPAGEPGADGSSGPTGADGPANNLTIGTVTTGAPGSPADATITGTPPAQQLNLTIPRGADGAGLLLVDPTGVIGLTMVPGVATTTSRSDSAPPLSQAIAPTWTGQHLFRGPVSRGGVLSQITLGLVTSIPLLGLTNSAAPTNAKTFEAFVANTGELVFQALDEAATGGRDILRVSRTGAAVAALNFGNVTDNPPYNFLGTGVTSVSGQIVVGAPTGGATGTGTINATGFYINGVALAAAVAGNPSALVGLTAINGSGVTFMRSDAAPALNQAIAPTWTGLHTFTGSAGFDGEAIRIMNASPMIYWQDTDAGGNTGIWVDKIAGTQRRFAISTDGGTYQDYLLVVRALAGQCPQFIFGNAAGNPVYNFLGSGLTTHSGSLQVNGDHIAIANTDTYFEMRDTDAGTDEKVYWLRNSGGTFAIQTRADSLSAGVNALTFTRAGVTPTQMLVGADGTLALPAISWFNDNDSGFWRRGSGDVALSLNGVLGAVFSATQTAFPLSPVYVVDGTIALPGLAFNGDTNCGLARTASDLSVAVSGGVNLVEFLGPLASGLPRTRFNRVASIIDGTAAAPALIFEAAITTGLFRPAGTSSLGFAANGVEGARITTGGGLQVTGGLGSGFLAAPGIELGMVGSAGYLQAYDRNASVYLNMILACAFANVSGYGGNASMGDLWIGGKRALTNFNDGGLYFNYGTPFTHLVLDGNPINMYAAGVLRARVKGSVEPLSVYGGATQGSCYIGFYRPDTTTRKCYLGYGDTNSDIFYVMNEEAGGDVRIGTAGVVRLTIAAAGGASFSSTCSATSFTTTSARASKRETGAPQYAADILARLRPILYRLLAGDDREQVGLIAEEVHEVCPQLSDGKTVAYDRLALLLLAAWQDERAEAA